MRKCSVLTLSWGVKFNYMFGIEVIVSGGVVLDYIKPGCISRISSTRKNPGWVCVVDEYLGEKLAGDSSRPGLVSKAALLFE